jgi:hypothetical protein
MTELPAVSAPARIPTPGQLGKAPLPPQPSKTHDASRPHCLDTGVGISFAHVNRLDLLINFLTGRLQAVDDVVDEVLERATGTLEAGHDHVDRLVKVACQRVRTCITGSDIVTVTVWGASHERIRALMRRMRELDPSPNLGKHRGEAATIAYAESLRPRGIILTNDGAAQKVAQESGVPWHSSASLLRLMVRGGYVSNVEAFELFTSMDSVSGCAGPRPNNPDWFTR